MKRLRKRLTALCSAAAVILTMTGAFPYGDVGNDLLTAEAAGIPMCQSYFGRNLNSNHYANSSKPIDSYLHPLEDGGYLRFQNGAFESGYLVEYYDAEFQLQSYRHIEQELPEFGGFYAYGDCYFILTGQKNPYELDDVECYRVTKYDKNWKRLASDGLYDCDTQYPFYGGCARFVGHDDQLYIRTAHTMYKDTIDYRNHQSNHGLKLDITEMKLKQGYTDFDRIYDYGYVSHSFNQFILMDGDTLVTVDHGDGYPRSVVLQCNPSNTDDWLHVLEIPGEVGANSTGTKVGGFEITDKNYLIAYSAENLADGTVDDTTQNIYVAVMDKETNEVTHRKITDYEDGTVSAYTPHFVRLADDRFMLLWVRENTVFYTCIDSEGNAGEIFSIENALLSDCAPIVQNGQVVWYTWKNRELNFYTINVKKPSEYHITPLKTGHDIEVTEYPNRKGGSGTAICRACGEEFTFRTPDTMNIWWAEDYTDEFSSKMPVVYVNRPIYYAMEYYYPLEYQGQYDMDFYDYTLTISDEANVTRTDFSPAVGNVFYTFEDLTKLTFHKEGIYTLTFTHKFNPNLTSSYKFRVEHHPDHEVIVQPPADGSDVALKVCQDCDYTEEMVVISDFTMYWGTHANFYSTDDPRPHCVGSDFPFIIESVYVAENYDMTMEIEDTTIATHTLSLDAFDRISGKITCLKEGETQVRVYPTHNPALVRTYPLIVGHDYREGFCIHCNYECDHKDNGRIPGNCRKGEQCAACGIVVGEKDPNVHDTLGTYVKNETDDPNTHFRFYQCCSHKDEEPHEYVYSEYSDAYYCECGETPLLLLENGDEVICYSDFATAFADAKTYSNATFRLSKTADISPAVLEAGEVTIDLNGNCLEFQGTENSAAGFTIEKSAKLTIKDSIGLGSVSADTDMILFDNKGGTLLLEQLRVSSSSEGVRLTGGTLHVNNGFIDGDVCINVLDGQLIMSDNPYFQGLDSDIRLSDTASILLKNDLGISRYRIDKESVGAFVTMSEGVTADSKWFEPVQNGIQVCVNEDGGLSLKYDITDMPMQIASDTAEFTGKANPPTVSVLHGDQEAEISLSYRDSMGNEVDDPIASGTYTVTVHGAGDYTGTQTFTYTISEPAISVTGYHYEIIPAQPQYRYADDSEKLSPADLIEKLLRYEVYSDGTQSKTAVEVKDLSIVSFRQTPDQLYAAGTAKYSLTAEIEDAFGKTTIADAASVYIGVRGDANQDGTADAKDAAVLLTYAAKQGAGNAAVLYSESDDALEQFVFFLAEVDASGKADALDAAAILRYAAAAGSGEVKTWEEILGIQ